MLFRSVDRFSAWDRLYIHIMSPKALCFSLYYATVIMGGCNLLKKASVHKRLHYGEGHLFAALTNR